MHHPKHTIDNLCRNSFCCNVPKRYQTDGCYDTINKSIQRMQTSGPP